MNKLISIIITVVLVATIGIVVFGLSKKNPEPVQAESSSNVEIKDGVQYVSITARGGYSPTTSQAKADMPTKLIMKTKDTYDCSLALVIKSIGYKKILAQTGEEIIDLGSPKAGTLQGLCSMGMYNFSVNFQ